MRVKVKDWLILNQAIRNRKGVVMEQTTITPPEGKPYEMCSVKLDKVVDLGTCIVTDEIKLPIECFEEIKSEQA